MKQIDLREGAKRQHRACALFAVIQCWLRRLDGVAFERQHLERLLGLERFKSTRVGWMIEDFSDFFPFHKVCYYSGKSNSFATLFVCRKEFEKNFPSGPMSTARRIEGIHTRGPRFGVFQIWEQPDEDEVLTAFSAAIPFFADAVNYDERLLASYLSLLIQGQISPRALPQFQK